MDPGVWTALALGLAAVLQALAAELRSRRIGRHVEEVRSTLDESTVWRQDRRHDRGSLPDAVPQHFPERTQGMRPGDGRGVLRE